MKEVTQNQRTNDWYKARLGMFTASQIYKLMGATDLKNSEKMGQPVFGETANSYISLLAGERKIKETVWDRLSDEEIEDFIRTQYPSNKAMAWGTEHEASARLKFAFEQDKEITETGSCMKEERPYVSASPDGIVKDENALIEIKCPQMETFCKYTDRVVDAVTLKDVQKSTGSQYYWQIMLQLYVTDADFCYFVWFHPFLGEEFIRVERNEEDIKLLLSRIDSAEEVCERIYNKL